MYLGRVTGWVDTQNRSLKYILWKVQEKAGCVKKMFHCFFVCLFGTQLKTGGCADVWKIYLAKSADPVLQAGRRLKWKRCKTDWNIYWSKKHSCMLHAILRWASVRVIWLRLFAAKFSIFQFAEAGAFSFWISISEIRQWSCASSTLKAYLLAKAAEQSMELQSRREMFK